MPQSTSLGQPGRLLSNDSMNLFSLCVTLPCGYVKCKSTKSCFWASISIHQDIFDGLAWVESRWQNLLCPRQTWLYCSTNWQRSHWRSSLNGCCGQQTLCTELNAADESWLHDYCCAQQVVGHSVKARRWLMASLERMGRRIGDSLELHPDLSCWGVLDGPSFATPGP